MDIWSPSLDPPNDQRAIQYSAEYEWMRAAHWRGYKWEQFDALDGDDQARIVAEYLTEQRIASVQYHNRPKAPHAANRRNSSGRGRR